MKTIVCDLCGCKIDESSEHAEYRRKPHSNVMRWDLCLSCSTVIEKFMNKMYMRLEV